VIRLRRGLAGSAVATNLPRAAALLATVLAAAAAVASLFGPEPVQRLVGSASFVVGTGLLVTASLLAAVVAARRRTWSGALWHVGLAAALVGVFINQHAAHRSYLFLEKGAGATNSSLGRDFRHREALPEPLALDSVTTVRARAFRPAPVVWVTAGNERSIPVTYNHPLRLAGRQVIVSQVAAPGFLTGYEVTVNGSAYKLLHNQLVDPLPGLQLSSFAYDAESGRVGLNFGHERRWLGIGESTPVRGGAVKLVSARFAADVGAVLVVNDIRYRFIVFAGFGLVLLGLLPPLFSKETS